MFSTVKALATVAVVNAVVSVRRSKPVVNSTVNVAVAASNAAPKVAKPKATIKARIKAVVARIRAALAPSVMVQANVVFAVTSFKVKAVSFFKAVAGWLMFVALPVLGMVACVIVSNYLYATLGTTIGGFFLAYALSFSMYFGFFALLALPMRRQVNRFNRLNAAR